MYFSALDQQVSSLDERFKEVSAQFDMSTQRLKAISNFFDKIRNIYKDFLKKEQQTSVKTFDKLLITKSDAKPVAPGNPGLTEIYSLLILEMIQTVSKDANKWISFITDNVISPINEAVTKREKIYNDACSNFMYTLNKRNHILQCCTKDQSQVNDIINRLEKQHLDLSRGMGLKPKDQQKMKKEIINLCQQYRSCLRNSDVNITKLNDMHGKFVKLTTLAINQFTSLEPQRMELLKHIFDQFPNHFKTIAEEYANTASLFRKPMQNWENDFMMYINNHGFVRTGYVPYQFEPYQFSFDDPQLLNPIYKSKQYLNSPLYIATVKENYTPNIPNGIAASANERLLIYDNKVQKYVLAAKSTDEKPHYFPSNNLIFSDEKIAIIKNDQLHISDDFLEVHVGEVVKVNDADADEIAYLCENLKGEKGMVNVRCLYLK